MSTSTLRVAVVYPDLLGTYGDGGNGLVVARRAAWRGQPVELLEATSDQPLPTADVYCLGGGEDGPQVLAADRLRADGTLSSAVRAGAVVLAVCAGYQIVGRSFPSADGQEVPGVGLLDVTTVKGSGTRAVGELLAKPTDSALGLPVLTGFENHAGHTSLGPGVDPLASVVSGIGNGDGSEGARSGRVIGTYCHGPVLARNPALADLLLTWATGEEPAPLDDRAEEALRHERLTAAGRRGVPRLRFGRVRRR